MAGDSLKCGNYLIMRCAIETVYVSEVATYAPADTDRDAFLIRRRSPSADLASVAGICPREALCMRLLDAPAIERS